LAQTNGDQNAAPQPDATEETKKDSDVFSDPPRFTITEKAANKDYRSFAAQIFGSAAFKMLEWLSPNAVASMTEQAEAIEGNSDRDKKQNSKVTSPQSLDRERTKTSADPSSSESPSAAAAPAPLSANVETSGSVLSGIVQTTAQKTQEGEGNSGDISTKEASPRRPVSSSTLSNPTANSRRNSNTKVRTPTSTKAKRRLSVDTFPPEPSLDELLPGLRSPRMPPTSDKNPKSLKNGASTIPRPISQLSNAGYFDGVSLEKMPPPKHSELHAKLNNSHSNGWRENKSQPTPRPGSSSTSRGSEMSPSQDLAPVVTADPDSDDDNHLPQALRRLNAEVVDFVCDVLQDDNTLERHLLEPARVPRFHTRFSSQPKPLKRRHGHGNIIPLEARMEWSLFIEQTLFYTLSDSQAVIRSFSKDGRLYDSQTLWYCMLRLTRVAPSLVFHSLWMAAELLFAPPRSVQTLRSPTLKLFSKQSRSLSNSEAGMLMSICLHALVAAAPLVNDSRQLYDMSRIRSHGLSTAGSGAVARQPADLCLQYDDAFSHDLAMRLARRVFTAINTRRCFDFMLELRSTSDDQRSNGPDILAPLFSQLDFLNMDAVYILNFCFSDRTVHENRVPTLLLDWARAVMMHDWDGRPEVPSDGPFGGALTLIHAMCK
jgi:hypothetical protein